MHTEIEIKRLDRRALLLYYYEAYVKENTIGNKLSLPIHPNKAKNQSDKLKLLKKLKFEIIYRAITIVFQSLDSDKSFR